MSGWHAQTEASLILKRPLFFWPFHGALNPDTWHGVRPVHYPYPIQVSHHCGKSLVSYLGNSRGLSFAKSAFAVRVVTPADAPKREMIDSVSSE